MADPAVELNDDMLDDTMDDVLENIDKPEEEPVVEEVEKPRDESGKFVKKEEEVEGEVIEEAAEEIEEGVIVPEDQVITEPEPEDPTLAIPPSSWDAEAKSKWSELPSWAKQTIKKRDAESVKGVQQLRDKAGFGEQLDKVIRPYMPMISADGGTPVSAVNSLLNTAYRLRTGTPQEKAQLLLEVGQMYGADLSQLNKEQDPNAPDFSRYLSPITQKLSQLERSLTDRQMQEQTQQETYYQQQITDFQNEVDESGNVKHLYFDNVRNHMAALIQAAEGEGKTLSLQEAYDEAIWANPDIRKLLLSQQSESEKAKSQQAQREKAEKAKKAANANIKSKPAHETQQPKPTGSIDDTMDEVMNRIHSR